MLARPLAILLPLLVVVAASAQTLPAPRVLRVDGGRADQGFAVASDAAGNAYVAGSVEENGRPTRFAVIKYDARGRLVWRSHAPAAFGGPVGEARSVAVDAAGNVYATGRVFVTTGFEPVVQGLLVKLGSDGSVRWTRALGNTNPGVRVVLNAAGDVVVGSSSGTALAFDAAGKTLWQHPYVGEAAGDTFSILDLAADADGNVIVAGTGVSALNATLRFAADAITIKYDAVGRRVWQRVYSDTPVSDEHVAALAVEADGGVVVTGTHSADTAGELPVTPLLLKYDANGVPLLSWIDDRLGGSDVAVDEAGEIVVAGSGHVTRLSAAGEVLWSTLSASAFGVERLALGAQGSVYASGGLATGLLGADGRILANQIFTDGNRDRTITQALHRDGRGVVYAVGTSSAATSTSADLIALRYAAGEAPPPPALPAPPSRLTGAVAARGATLRWQDDSANETGFRIERCRGASCSSFKTVAETAANVTSFVDTGLRRNRAFRYRVRALNAAGASAASNVATVRVP
jgi:hypothetical protein